ncbi:hypothetical protein COCCADRAFT_36161 [Bipolaris zeicola 26-R-13]|uniref:Uncharacterized protein n=1 Tax=Cochliobolus carbonum (strain 26-R-13) TaxID=930089 RepID=W6Y9A8_COCC2|nr:uncharacterized protein COCCADRAFT_36161 [Bipolaris zeicola 26-R-13]EUC34100.1 hypothetical protein COCCADRAFT_36161 [Bipolaris zeicola 26-R-13]
MVDYSHRAVELTRVFPFGPRVCHCFLATGNGFTLLAINSLAMLDDQHKQGAAVRRDSAKRKYTKGNMEYMPKEKRYGDNNVAGGTKKQKREKVNPRISQRKAVITGIFSCFLHIQHAHFLLYGEDRIHSINHLAPQKAKRNPSIRTPLVPKGSTRLHPFSNTRLSQNDPLSTT